MSTSSTSVPRIASEKTPISVCVRFRPRSAKEVDSPCIQCISDNQVAFCGLEGEDSNVFSFDKIYQEDTSQAQVFEDVRHVVHAVLEGQNGTIMTYGQTGSGKTHTLIGDLDSPEEWGVVPRALKELASGVGTADYAIHVCAIEIYKEKIHDLLNSNGVDLQVKQDPRYGVFVSGAVERPALNEQELIKIIKEGLANRSVAATAMNSMSSRSHCVVYVVLEKFCTDGTTQYGKLTMVDLAGSERQAKTGARGAVVDEGILINKSLSALANVVSALADEKTKHIPYRDSKLTRVLQDSLGGTSKSAMIVCCSPCKDNGRETLSSLRFGSRAQGITNTVQRNHRIINPALEEQLIEARGECERLAQELEKALKLECSCCSQNSTASESPNQLLDFQETASSQGSSPHGVRTKYIKISKDGRAMLMLLSALVYFLIEDWYF